MELNIEINRRWEYYDHCKSQVVICCNCGNNCYKGGYGEIIDSESGRKTECQYCESAYELQDKGIENV